MDANWIHTSLVLALILLTFTVMQADKNTTKTINSLVKRLDAAEVMNSNLQAEVASLKENMALMMTEVSVKDQGHTNMLEHLNEELGTIRSDFEGKHTSLTTTFENHLSNYLQQIQDAIDSRERCQTGVVKVDHNRQVVTREVEFIKPFLETPVMSWGVIKMDAHRDFNLRFNITVTDVTKSGFTFRANSWMDTILYWYAISWIACTM